MMRRAVPALLLSMLTACASTRQPERPAAERARAEEGLASFYSDALHGRTTANGEKYLREKPTCAHRTHRFGTELRVTVLDSQRSAVCRVNDRGPYVRGRIVDVSRSVARALELEDRGVAPVRVEVVD
ncbi:MAG: septal ring lytic transglycosylase RlpA family protein [Myxococcales bacterium]